MTLEYSSLYGLRRLGREYMAIREEILWVARFPNTFWSSLRGNCIVSRHDGLTKKHPGFAAQRTFASASPMPPCLSKALPRSWLATLRSAPSCPSYELGEDNR